MREDNKKITGHGLNAYAVFNKGMNNESIWNIFVQILLPLVLVLTFVAALDIMRYKQIAFVEKEGRMDCEKAFRDFEETEKGEALIREGIAIEQAQLQVLLRALLMVKEERENELKLLYFRTQDVELESGSIRDDDFKILCQKTKTILGSNRERKKFSEEIYSGVIEKASEINFGIDGLKDVNTKIDNKYNRKLIIVIPNNREIIIKEIDGFISAIENDTVRIQENTLIRIFEYLKRHPEELGEEERLLIKEILDPQTNNSRRENLANLFYQNLITRLKQPITRDGYDFLDKTWDKFRTI